MSKDINVGDWVRIKPGHVEQDNVEFQVTKIKNYGPSKWGTRVAEGDPLERGVWFRFLDKIDPPKPTLDFVADARSTLLNPVVAYRKELIALLDTSGPDARPIVQAKLSAVNEVIARIQ